MKQLHKVSSSSAYKRDEELPMSLTQPYSPKFNKNRSLSRTFNYILREQRLLFIIVGILIGSAFFIFQPTLFSRSDPPPDQRSSHGKLTETINLETGAETENQIQEKNDLDFINKDEPIVDNNDGSVVDNKDDKDDLIVDNKDDRDDSIVDNRDDSIVDNRDDSIADNKDDSIADNKDDSIVDSKDDTIAEEKDVSIVDDKEVSNDDGKDARLVDNKDIPVVDYGEKSGKSGRIPVEIKGRRLRIVVTGGSGFVGSHLVDQLMGRGHEVIVLDNFFTGRKENVVHHLGNPRFELIRHDVVEPILLEVDQIFHLACPASPVHYKYNPVKTIKTNVMGTLNMLGLAKRVGARFLLTSTSEVYGDPLEHPQKETYWGNVNPIGERSCYDEGKRVAETLSMDYHRGAGVEVRVARIFNTYGPRMCLDDGRVVSNFVSQAIKKQPMTIYGDGKQTRSFQYVSDLVNGFLHLMEGEHIGPFNLGNPGEFTMLELAEVVKQVIDPSATIEFKPNTADDPQMRKPDISKAKKLLNWEPKISLKEGLPRMVSDFRNRIINEDEGKGNK